MKVETIKTALEDASKYPDSKNVQQRAKKIRHLLRNGYSMEGYSVANTARSLVWALGDAKAVYRRD